MGQSVDLAIVGGGAAGLWTLALARSMGVSAVLLEGTALGDGQTVASQGILHAGVKYDGVLDRPSASTPILVRALKRWRRALNGEGEVDLRGVRVRSEHTWFWTTRALASKAVAMGAAALMRTDVRRVGPGEYPEGLRGAPGGVRVYRAGERVIAPESLIEELARRCAGAVVLARATAVATGGDAARVVALCGQDEVTIEARHVVLAAGSGNAPLLESMGEDPPMQTRPLHMVMVDGAPAPVYGHCLGLSPVPRVTVTSAPSRSAPDRWVWYVGGGVAEEGVGRSREEQIEACRVELALTLPWADLSGCRWATLRIDRAEGRTESGTRPAGHVVEQFGRVLAVWPTKLVLAPLAAEAVLKRVLHEVRGGGPGVLGGLPVPGVAPLPWEREGVAWS